MTGLLAITGSWDDGQVIVAAIGAAIVAAGVVYWLLAGELGYRRVVREARPPVGAGSVRNVTSPSTTGEDGVFRAAPPSSKTAAGHPFPASPTGSHRRLVADALIVARGFSPEVERAGVNGSGIVDLAERDASYVMAALRDGEVPT